MHNFLSTRYCYGFYKAIILAFFFTFAFSNNFNIQDSQKCIWIKSEQLNNKESIEEAISNAYRTGYKIIFAQIDIHENHNYNPFLSSDQGEKFDSLEVILYWANLYGLEVHVWINAYKIWSSKFPPPSNHVFYQLNKSHQDWFATDINGYMDYSLDMNNSLNNFSGIFLSPLNPESNQYIKNIINKILNDYSRNGIPLIDGIHLDYLRYKDSMYGYNYVGRKLFYDQNKIDPVYLNRNFYSSDSTKIFQNNWNNFKSNQINFLLKDLYGLLNDKKGKDLKLSVAVKPNIYEAKIRWNQNWDEWIDGNYIDFVVIMNYFPDSESFSNNLFKLSRYFNQNDLSKIYIGINTIEETLGLKELKDINIIKEQIKNTSYYRFGGIAIFSYEYSQKNPKMYLEILEIFSEESN